MAMSSKIEKQLHLMNLVQSTAEQLINFLSCLNNSTKEVWERKRNVTETFYIVTIGNIPELFYPEVASCEAQWSEWEKLLSLSEFPSVKQARLEFLKKHPTLPIDTRHFSTDFTDRLLSGFDNLDAITDGLLIHSENWQALNFISEQYREKIKCIYIDPPYNTGSNEFLYEDNYQHSSWLSMIHNRIAIAYDLLTSMGTLLVSIDTTEQARLELLLQEIIGVENYLTTFVWEGGRKNNSRLVSISHEYIECFVKNLPQLKKQNINWKIRKKGIDIIYRKVDALIEKFGDDYKVISQHMKDWLESLPTNHPAKKHKHYWAVDERGVYFPSDISRPGGGGPKYEVIHPITCKPCKVPERGWMYATPERMAEAISKNLVHFWDEHTKVPCAKIYLKENEFTTPSSVFYIDRRGAIKRLRHIMGRATNGREVFEYPKDEKLLAMLFSLVLSKDDYILDFFAGSGTTAHAVINLNREDGGQRKFILVEMAHYFDTVLIPRIKKITFTSAWKNGKPKRAATEKEAQYSPRIIKVIRLDSFNEALL